MALKSANAKQAAPDILKLRALIHPVDDGRFWAEVPGLSGCYSVGHTFEEISENIAEAATGLLEVIAEAEADNPGVYTDRTPSLTAMIKDAEPECDPKMYKEALVHNYCQLYNVVGHSNA